jgi:hypothetical protein
LGIAISLLTVTAGAILRYAITSTPSGVDIGVIGLILMVIGLVGLVISLIDWLVPLNTWIPRRERRTYVERHERPVDYATRDYPPRPRDYPPADVHEEETIIRHDDRAA